MHPSFLTRALDVAAELLAPSLCTECGLALGSRKLFCEACGGSVHGPINESVGGISCIAIGRYEGALARAVRRFKYAGRSDLASPLAKAAARAIDAAAIRAPALLVPVPLHPRRLAERGYDQSVLLASALGKILGWRVAPDALCRTRLTLQQAMLDRARRFENARGAFRAKGAVSGRVVLVDDVVTTLATALECTAVLADVGADVVAIVAAARRGSAPE